MQPRVGHLLCILKGYIVNYCLDNLKPLTVSETIMLINQRACVSLKGGVKFEGKKILQLVLFSYFVGLFSSQQILIMHL